MPSNSNRNVLIVAAHPDDEILGVGGTAAMHVARGDRVSMLIMAEGATSRDPNRNVALREKEIAALREATARAIDELGLTAPRFGELPDNRMDSLELLDVVKLVEQVVLEVEPDIVYTHHNGDLNIDHGITHRAVLTACRPLPGTKPRSIYTFETVSSTEWSSPELGIGFRPQRFVEITGHLEKKLRALAHYKSEMQPFPHARSIKAVEALARLRGSQVGVEAAEGFMVVREIVTA